MSGADPAASKSRLVMVAPFGTARVGVPPVAERLSRLLEAEGFDVIRTSTILNPLGRAADIAATLILRIARYDTVIAQVFSYRNFAYAGMVALLARMLRKRAILYYHGGAAEDFLSRWPRVVRWVLHRTDGLVVPSAFLQRIFLAFGFAATVIPNVIEEGRWKARVPRPGRSNVVWVRHLHPMYNPEMAIRAMEGVLAARPDAQLTIVGHDDAGLLGGLRTLADKACDDHVRFTGALPQSALADLLRDQDVFISTARVDNQPSSVLEAMAVGIPVIATRVGGIPDLIADRVNGLLVESDDARSLGDAIVAVLEDQALAERLVAGGRETVRRHFWPEVRADWERLLRPGSLETS